MFNIDDWATIKIYMEYIIPFIVICLVLFYLLIIFIIKEVKIKYVLYLHKDTNGRWMAFIGNL